MPENYDIFVKYDNIPDEILDDFNYHRYIEHCRIFSLAEILFSSSNKEDVDISMGDMIVDMYLDINEKNQPAMSIVDELDAFVNHFNAELNFGKFPWTIRYFYKSPSLFGLI